MKRVVVTGMGTINPLGFDVPTTWSNLLEGKSGATRISRFDPQDFYVQIACEVKDFRPEDHFGKKEVRRIDRFAQFAMVSAREAARQAGLDVNGAIRDEVGVIIGTGIGGLETMDEGYHALFEEGPKRVSPLTSTMMIADMAAGRVSMDMGLRGPNYCLTSACATSGHAIGEAFETIRRGDALAMFAGGSEAALVPFAIAAFHRTGALSTRNDDPEHASRPFDKDRDGFVFGEGAAIILLEELEFARERGAKILAEVVGYGASADAYHVSAPDEDGSGAALAISRALRKAGLRPDEVDYINAHGTSTVLNDKSETLAIKRVFGDHAYEVPISSTKSMIGHLLGAAGAIEAIVCVKSIQEQLIHPTMNYETPDPECDLNYTPNEARRVRVRVALSNSFGFGGHNATLVFQAP